ncbi:MAG TPA: class I SAM-dependent rRNA methyltransferase [Planctomycetaceae bacterium]|nr:class I SAM-dependent rRNA methyltransferase [Planctomycetaceae bacterium]
MPPTALPQVVLKPRRALPFFGRHPWVFAGAIARVEGSPQAGDELAVVSHEGQFIARGLFNPHSNIRVRLYAWDQAVALDEAFWSERLDAAIGLRRDLFAEPGPETACRLVFSEADGLSGLTVDRYGEWLLVQLTSRALAERRDVLFRLLGEKLRPAGIWLRTEKGIGEAEGLEIADGLVAGREPPRPLFIAEHGLRYGCDVVEGQKTGFYIDQRDNRAAFARYVRPEARVLDVFCYSGGFGLAAVVLGGAKHVLSVDVSEAALALARANAQLNGVADRFRFEAGRAFEVLERLQSAGERFDAVVLDPPRMTRHKAGVSKALQAYHQLNRQAVDLLVPGGLLVTCSCSGLVTREDFERMLAEVSLRVRRPLQILESRGAAADHPTSVHCPETAYLKCYVCRAG